MSEKSKSSNSKLSLGLLITACVLAVALGVCVFFFCQKSESYTPRERLVRKDASFTGPVPFTTVYPTTAETIRQSQGIHKKENPYARCGPDCQSKSKFADPSAYPGPFLPYYPVLPANPNQASPASDAWLHNATPQDVHNLTRPVKVGGKKVPFRCNKSCPPQEVACGLDQRGLSKGVM